VSVVGEVVIVWFVIKWDVGLWTDISQLNNSLAASCVDGNVIVAEVDGVSERLTAGFTFIHFVSHFEPVSPSRCWLLYVLWSRNGT